MPIELELQVNETFPAHKKRKQKGIKKRQREKEKEMNRPKLVLEHKGNLSGARRRRAKALRRCAPMTKHVEAEEYKSSFASCSVWR